MKIHLNFANIKYNLKRKKKEKVNRKERKNKNK